MGSVIPNIFNAIAHNDNAIDLYWQIKADEKCQQPSHKHCDGLNSLCKGYSSGDLNPGLNMTTTQDTNRRLSANVVNQDVDAFNVNRQDSPSSSFR